MSLKSFQKEINILKSNLNLDQLLINRERILTLTGTESPFEIIQEFKKDINYNVKIIMAIVSLLQNPNELIEEGEDLDLLNIPIVKSGLLNKFIAFKGTDLKEYVEQNIISEFFNDSKMERSYLENYSPTKLKLMFNNIFQDNKDKEEYLKYSRNRVEVSNIASYIMGNNISFKEELDTQRFEAYTTQLAGSSATVYMEKKGSTVLEVKDGKIETIALANNFEIDEELTELLLANKYIDKIEIDQDETSLRKLKEFLLEIKDLNFSTEAKFYLKIRKLGRHNATGLYYSGFNILAVDINNEYSFAHEVAHHIDFTSTIENRDEIVSLGQFNSYKNTGSKLDYYSNHYEIVARAGETAYAIKQSDFSTIYEAYLNGTEYNGEIVTTDNFYNLLSSNSFDSRLAKSLEYYERNSSVYFDIKNRTPEELALFYSYFQNLYNFDEKIEIKADEEKKQLAEYYTNRKIDRQSAKRTVKKGFATYSKQDFLNVLEDFDNGLVSITNKKDFYIDALLSSSHSNKIMLLSVLSNDPAVDNTDILNTYISELKKQNIDLAEQINNMSLEGNINEEELFNFLFLSPGSIIDLFENQIDKVTEKGNKVPLTDFSNFIDNILLTNGNLINFFTLINNFKNIDNLNISKLMYAIIKNVQAMKPKLREEYALTFINNCKDIEPELQKEVYKMYIISTFKGRLAGRLPTLIKDTITLSDEEKKEINKEIMEDINNMPDGFYKKDFIQDNIEFLPLELQKEYGVISSGNIMDITEDDYEELYIKIKENNLTIIPITVKDLKLDNITDIKNKYIEVFSKINNLHNELDSVSISTEFNIENNNFISFEDNKLASRNIKKILTNGDIIENVGEELIVYNQEDKTSFGAQYQKRLMDRNKGDIYIETDTTIIKKFFPYRELEGILIDSRNEKCYGLKKFKSYSNFENTSDTLILDNEKQDFVYVDDKANIIEIEGNDINVTYDKPSTDIDILTLFGRDFDETIIKSCDSIKDLHITLLNLVQNFKGRTLLDLIKYSKLSDFIWEKFNVEGLRILNSTFAQDIITNNQFIEYTDFSTILPTQFKTMEANEQIEVIKLLSNDTILISKALLPVMEDILKADHKNSNIDEQSLNQLLKNKKEDITRTSLKYTSKIYNLGLREINFSNLDTISIIEKILETEFGYKEKYPLNDILEVIQKNIDSIPQLEDTIDVMLDNNKSKKATNMKDLVKLIERFQDTSFADEEFNIGNKNIFDFTDNSDVNSTSRKSTIILKVDDKKLIHGKYTLPEMTDKLEILRTLNDTLKIDRHSRYSISQANLGFLKLENSIIEIISKDFKKLLTTSLTKKEVKASTKEDTKSTKMK